VRRPRTRYARSGDASIAYQTVGDGPIDLVVVNGPASHLEVIWDEPATARCFERLASFSRLVLFDRRGTGLSDPVSRPPTLEQQMDDLSAVLDAVGLEQTAIWGASDLGLSALFAATFPERVTALLLSSVASKGGSTLNPALREQFLDAIENNWGDGTLMSVFAPSQIGNPVFEEWWGRMQRSAVSPGMARQLMDMLAETDLRAILPTIRVPTLVMHNTGDRYVAVEHGREVASLIPGARFIEYPGEDNYGLVEARGLEDVEEFLTGRRPSGDIDRVLATCCSPTSSARPSTPRGWAMAAGARCCTSTTRLSAPSWIAGAEPRSRRSATASWPRSTDRHGPCIAPRRSSTQ
jgi:pimeloyl-ACP methyl ester carboxylesterase